MEQLQPETKQINLLWEGHKYKSVENCVLTIQEKGNEITAVVIGDSGEKPFRLDYTIRTNQKWETVFFDCYQYRNINNGSEALLTVDEQGLVVVYPTRFKRGIHVESNY